ncbi:hypothetical protein [Streptomyces sp. SID3212]|uniref:hypothetical protein n=1 Tax=Streptomyces sp. SID3212 TaxID=2690259 RepID=UPI001370B836|nr:hypothetical protein [Streptomyces sp. SID3212]MYV56517.1 hypothetical protein [Streptomyces sp. SID3212]
MVTMTAARPKRSDLTTVALLTAVQRHGFNAWETLAAAYPPKLVQAAIQRDIKAGHLEYGVSLERPWLTPQGTWRLNADSRR